MKNLERRFLLVDVSVLPEVFLKVLKAKELLAAGSAKNVSAATEMAGLSRSAFYKYKDCIFDAENSKEVLTVNATLLDETGALQSAAGGHFARRARPSSPSTRPRRKTARHRWPCPSARAVCRCTLEDMLAQLKKQRTVVDIRRGV